MPNWCENDLTIRGPYQELQRFRIFAKTKNGILDADKFIHYPKKYAELDLKAKLYDARRNKLIDKLKKEGVTENNAREKAYKKYLYMKDGFNSGGYEWCIENWGTKWGICDAELIDNIKLKNGKGELFYQFSTAWSPPTPLIQKMGEMFNGLVFALRYFERGDGFKGILKIEKGKVIADETSDYYGERGG